MRKVLTFIFSCLIGWVMASEPQPDSVQVLEQNNKYLDLSSPYSLYQIRDRDQEPITDNWIHTPDSIYFTQNQTVWISYRIYNPQKVPALYFFNGKNLDYFSLELRSKGIITKAENGLYAFNSRFNTLQFLQLEKFTVPAKDTVDVLLKVNFYKPFFADKKPNLLKMSRIFTGSSAQFADFQQRYWEKNIYELQVRSMVQGALLLITLLSIFLLVRNKNEKLFLFYFGYVITAFFFTIFASRSFTYAGQFLSRFPLIRNYGNELCLWIGLAAYFRFIPELLSLKKLHNSLYKLALKVSWVSIFIGLVIFIFLILTNDMAFYNRFDIFSRIPLVFVYLYFLYRIRKEIKGPLVRFVIIANLVLLILGLIAWLKKVAFNDIPWPGILNHIFTMPAAVLAEIVVFSLAIAYKIGEDQRQKSLLTQKLVETEMQALRSQMNPHFLYNCINSIKYYVIKNDAAQASLYLNKFAKLIRKFLSSSQMEFISLESELETLSLYLEMEKLRFGDRMNFMIDVDENLETSFIRIPAMLIQPFLENAIWHGLMHKTNGTGELILKIKEEKDQLHIEITDNGVGRIKAAEYKSKSLNENKSLGMKMTENRIEHLNEIHDTGIEINVVDLIDGITNVASGTQIHLRMKTLPVNE